MRSELNSSQFKNELYQNILPFWMDHALDRVNGGFVGGITNNLIIQNDIPRTAISCTRFLWTFSHAYLATGNQKYLEVAHHAYKYLHIAFWDHQYGGLYWSVGRDGSAISTRKHTYVQAFGIYGLSEYYKATRNTESLELSLELYNLLEQYALDPVYGGYCEGFAQDWAPTSDMRLGTNDLNSQKSMNTMLHTLEAYTNLVQVTNDSKVRDQLIKLIHLFQSNIIGPNNHFQLYFDQDWTSLSEHISHGHDIEGSWLLVEAANTVGDPDLVRSAEQSALRLASAVLANGIYLDGAIIQEASPKKITNANIEWWPQAEAVVGFYNAYQLSGNEEFKGAAESSWQFISAHLVDKLFGGWIKRLLPDRTVDEQSPKAGPWESPYHESRMCFELINRLK